MIEAVMPLRQPILQPVMGSNNGSESPIWLRSQNDRQRQADPPARQCRRAGLGLLDADMNIDEQDADAMQK